MANLDVLLAVCREFGPIGGDGRGQFDEAAVDQHQGGQTGDRLGGRPHVDDGVFGPRARPCGVLEAAPHVDDNFTVDVYGDACADLLAGGDVVGERAAERVKPLVAVSVNYVVHPVGSVSSVW